MAYEKTLAERLRARMKAGQPIYDCAEEAADRIEALEDWQSKQNQDIIKLGAMVGHLEQALREIVERQDTPRITKDIARAALKEGE